MSKWRSKYDILLQLSVRCVLAILKGKCLSSSNCLGSSVPGILWLLKHYYGHQAVTNFWQVCFTMHGLVAALTVTLASWSLNKFSAEFYPLDPPMAFSGIPLWGNVANGISVWPDCKSVLTATLCFEEWFGIIWDDLGDWVIAHVYCLDAGYLLEKQSQD